MRWNNIRIRKSVRFRDRRIVKADSVKLPFER
jgi:hypothetical protein